MPTRYDKRIVFSNDSELYQSLIEKRNLKSIRHYGTGVLRYPTPEELKGITSIRHIWKTGDKFYKLAFQHYNSSL